MPSGTVVSGFGNASESNSTAGDRYKYTGRELDSETGLQYNRARYYDPATQQFLTVDPLVGFTGQPYGYASGNPGSRVDPSGLDGSYGEGLEGGGNQISYVTYPEGFSSETGGLGATGSSSAESTASEPSAAEATTAESLRARITARLQRLANQVLANFDPAAECTPKQLEAIQRRPYLKSMYEGTQKHVLLAGAVAGDPELGPLLDLADPFEPAPDFSNPETGDWWDLTTEGEWPAHVRKYGPGGTRIDYP